MGHKNTHILKEESYSLLSNSHVDSKVLEECNGSNEGDFVDESTIRRTLRVCMVG